MHGNITSITPKLPSAGIKQRVITLTNRAPVRIKEDEWPVRTQGECKYDVDGAPYTWQVAIYVREEKKKYFNRTLIYAKYAYRDECEEDDDQIVRVGRIISDHEAMCRLWENIVEVGEELRQRIDKVKMRIYVTHAVDRCFADLPVHEM